MTRCRANALLMLAAMFWGFGNVAQKTVLEDLGPTLTSGLRCIIGLAVIAPFLLDEVRRSPPLTRSARRGIAVSAVLFSSAFAVQQRAFGGTSVTNASFLINTSVAFTPVFAWFWLRERPRLVTVPALVMVLGGVLLMGGGLTGFRLGDGQCIVAAALYSLWFVAVASVAHAVDRPFTLAAAQFGLSALIGTSLGVIHEPASPSALMSAASELFVLGEKTTSTVNAGAVLILASIVLVQVPIASFRPRLRQV